MKKIEAIINPLELEEVRKALQTFGLEEITVSDVRDFGWPVTRTEVFRGSEYTLEFQPMSKLDLVVEDAQAEGVVEAIFKSTQERNFLDGKVFISSLERVVGIATPEVRG